MTLRSRHEGNEKRPEANHGAEEMARSYDDMDEMLRKASAAGSAGSEWDGGDAGATSGGAGDGPAPAIKRRAPIACRRLVYFVPVARWVVLELGAVTNKWASGI